MPTSADLLARFYAENAGTQQPTYTSYGGLSGYTSIPGGSAPAAAAVTPTPRVTTPTTTPTVTNPYPVIQPSSTAVPTVTGSGIVDQAALIANMAAQNATTLGGLAGLLRPEQIGATGSDFLPTLDYRNAQETSALNRYNANLGRSSILAGVQDSQNAARLARSGQEIGIGEINANQRVQQEQLVQGILGLLTSLRGPSNAFAYNALLNNVGTPTGETVDPFATARQVYQPLDAGSILPNLDLSAIDVPALIASTSPYYNMPGLGAAPAAPATGAGAGAGAGTVQPASSPAAPSTRTTTPTATPTQQPAAQQQQAAPQQAVAASTVEPTSGRSFEVTQQHADYANQVIAQSTPEQRVSPTTGKEMTSQDLAAYTAIVSASPSSAANWLRANGYLGAAEGASVHMGGKQAKSKRGQKATDKRSNAPAARLSKSNKNPRQATPQGDDATVLAGDTGQPELVVGRDFDILDPEETRRALASGTFRDLKFAATGYSTGAPSPSDGQALGATLSYDRYTPEQIARLPIVGNLSGRQQPTAFGQTGLDFTLPGSGAQVGVPSYSTLNTLLPSEFDLAQSLYETPRELGGLGIDFRDIIALAQRQSPIGSGFPMITQLA